MKDNIIICVAIQLILLALVDFYQWHSFGSEGLVATINGLLLMYIHDREDKK